MTLEITSNVLLLLNCFNINCFVCFFPTITFILIYSEPNICLHKRSKLTTLQPCSTLCCIVEYNFFFFLKRVEGFVESVPEKLMVYLLPLYCKNSLLLCQVKEKKWQKEKDRAKKMPQNNSSGIQTVSSSMAEAGDIAAVSTVHDDWHKW